MTGRKALQAEVTASAKLSRQEPAWQVGASEQSGRCGWDIVNEGERYMKLEVRRGPVRKGPIGLESHRKES